jgi:hypothetical protein
MIPGNRGFPGNDMDRRNWPGRSASGRGVSLENSICKEKDVNIRLPFFDRIKAMLRGRINDRNFALNRDRTYVIELMPIPMQSGKRQHRANVDIVGKSGKSQNTAHPSFNNARLLFANKIGEERKQTPSNLG